MNQYLHQAIEQNRQNGYLQYHAPRFETLLYLLHEHHREGKRILDIGRSPFTEIASKSLNSRIDTLGFESDKEVETGFNYQFNLNDSQTRQTWRTDVPRYDIIIFAEVIEHLYTSPKLVLEFLDSLLTENGIIIIQTPNAVVAHKRLLLLIGHNPYGLISEDSLHPAHFREYTAKEISHYCTQTGFKIETLTFENYFDYRFILENKTFTERRRNRLINFMYSVMPRSLRPGLSIVIRSGKKHSSQSL